MDRLNKTPNVVIYDGPRGPRIDVLPVYPSAKVYVPAGQYMVAVAMVDSKTTPCVFFDGESILVPEYEVELIAQFVAKFSATVEYGQMQEAEFATLAVQAGVDGTLVRLGHAVQGCGLNPKEMLEQALADPAEAKRQWSELYLSSMNPQ